MGLVSKATHDASFLGARLVTEGKGRGPFLGAKGLAGILVRTASLDALRVGTPALGRT